MESHSYPHNPVSFPHVDSHPPLNWDTSLQSTQERDQCFPISTHNAQKKKFVFLQFAAIDTYFFLAQLQHTIQIE